MSKVKTNLTFLIYLLFQSVEVLMPVFAWEGRTTDGKTVRGELDAANEAVVRYRLRRQHISPVKVGKKAKSLNIPFLSRTSEKDIAVFTRQLATMINAGMPIVQALDILSKQQKNKLFKNILNQIKLDVEGGSNLAEALKKHPKVFDELFVNMVIAGETGGFLDQVLNRITSYKEKALALKKKVKGAMVYPAITLAVALIVLTIILVYVIPAFQEIFSDFGAALPAPTQFVIDLSSFTRRYIIYIFLGLVGFILFIRLIYRTEKGQYSLDRLLLKSPLLGGLLRKVAIARFSRTLSTMLQSGVPILQSLEIVAKTAGNKVIEGVLLDARKRVGQGEALAVSLSDSKVFPPLVVQMTAVGEQTGELEGMLAKVADFYEEEVDAAVDALTSMLEPAMMIFLGGLIGGLVISLYLPIFKMGAVVGG